MTPPKVLALKVESLGRLVPVRFPVRRLVNAGYVGRDQAAVKAHIDELRHEGIPAPATVPVLFPLATDNVTTDDEIEVLGRETSGEVEYVLFLHEEEVFVGVGSDHTDRALERSSMAKSKLVCKNVVSSTVWRYSELRETWDHLVLRSWVSAPETGEEILYQEGRLRSILSPEELIALVRRRLADAHTSGLVIFSGTIPISTGKTIYGRSFRCELSDPRTDSALVCSYRVVPLDYLRDGEV